MAKKSRKAKAAIRTTTSPQVVAASQAQAKTAGQKSARQQVTANAGAAQPIDYRYVSKDLINIGIITAALILVLIILTFIPALRA